MEQTPALIDTKDKAPDELRASILKLEAVMMAMPEHQIEIKTEHHFAPGVYVRSIFIPKGTTLTGKIHKTEHICILSQGEVSVYTDQGVKRLKASSIVQSSPGTKRVLFAHEDSVWVNTHLNPENETDLEKIEERLIAKSFDEIPGLNNPIPIEGGL